MAQTKRKRRTKHRGTAAGTVTNRGRTGRPPTAEERKKQSRATARERRMNQKPTWKSSATRAGFAAVIMFIFLAVTMDKKKGGGVAAALVFAVLAFVLYLPAGYYLEVFLWRRRQKRKETASR